MNIFKKLFGGESTEVTPIEETNVEAVVETEAQPTVEEVTPKTLNDIVEAKNKLEELEVAKNELINTHRNNIEQLISLGVNETQGNSIARSETYNDTLNPIEDEIKNIAEEISNIREDFDMQKSPKEILEARALRLSELCTINFNSFLNTDTGIKLLNYINEHNSESGRNLEFKSNDPVGNSLSIFSYCNSYSLNNITENIEYKDFSDRYTKIVKLMDKVDSKLASETKGE